MTASNVKSVEQHYKERRERREAIALLVKRAKTGKLRSMANEQAKQTSEMLGLGLDDDELLFLGAAFQFFYQEARKVLR